MQISIDNVMPGRSVEEESEGPRQEAADARRTMPQFHVNINAVLGGGISNPDDARTIAQARPGVWDSRPPLGSSTTAAASCCHSIRASADCRRDCCDSASQDSTLRTTIGFRRISAADNRTIGTVCAGARYLYICEEGLVHWCSQQRGRPGIPLERSSADDLEREFHRPKPCAPLCTVGCVHRVAQVDDLRQNPIRTLREWFTADHPGGAARPIPVAVRACSRGCS